MDKLYFITIKICIFENINTIKNKIHAVQKYLQRAYSLENFSNAVH